MSGTRSHSERSAAGAALPQRQAAPQPQPLPPRPFVRVLQTSRAPAQLSLFERPGITAR